MKSGIKLRIGSAVVLLGLSALMYSPPAEAQFLKKLTKGLEKVNKALDKVTNTKDQKTDKKSDQKAATGSLIASNQGQTTSTPEIKIPDQYIQPYLTDTTRFVKINPDISYYTLCNSITEVSEGVFGITHLGNWSFYDAETGELLYSDIGKTANRNQPIFSGGAAVVKTQNGHRILYADGRVKELDKSFAKVEDFVDGVSMVKTFDAKYNSTAYYIDINGEKIYPALTRTGTMTRPVSTYEVRHLRDNRRAVYMDGKWGYIDSNGKIVIPCKYNKVADFSEGHAWVCVQDGSEYKVGMIDETGNYTISPQYKWHNMDISEAVFGPMQEGIARISQREEPLRYVTATGQVLGEIADSEGTDFVNGHAFITSTSGTFTTKLLVIDREMNVVRILDNSRGTFNSFSKDYPHFTYNGLAVVDHNTKVINNNGDVVIAVPNKTGYELSLNEIKNGYAYAEATYNKQTIRGIMRADGSFSVVFGKSKEENNWKDPNIPFEPKPYIRDPREPRDPEHDEPRGPEYTPSPLYTVKVVANPPEGGSVSGGGKAAYGKEVSATATAAEEWKFSSWDAPTRSYTLTPGKFKVFEDMTVTANFIKKDDVKPTPDGAWEGDFLFRFYPTGSAFTDAYSEEANIVENIPVYLEMSSEKDIDTPMGKKYGYMTLMIDPDKQYVKTENRNTSGGSTCNMFYVPMTIEGMIEQDGEKYLLMQGGDLKLANITVLPGEKDGGINALMANIMLRLFGDDLSLGTATYLLKYEEKDGKVTLGNMKRFHSDYGWLAAGDDRFNKLFVSGAMWGVNSGLPADYFQGIELGSKPKRNDIQWYPPKSWVHSDEEFLDLRSRWEKAYSNFLNEYFQFWDK